MIAVAGVGRDGRAVQRPVRRGRNCRTCALPSTSMVGLSVTRLSAVVFPIPMPSLASARAASASGPAVVGSPRAVALRGRAALAAAVRRAEELGLL